ncbi:MAG: type ISP restriction/modification enzyme, partial [Dolichospermum sp.]
NRDSWTYNFSHSSILYNMKRMIEVYNNQIGKDEINNDPKCISWTRGLKKRLSKNEKLDLEEESIKIAIYRPFCKQWLYFSREFNEYVYKMPIFLPSNLVENQIICITGIGANKDFNCYIVNQLPDVQLQSNNLCFPLYTYEKQSELGEL